LKRASERQQQELNVETYYFGQNQFSEQMIKLARDFMTHCKAPEA